MTRYFFIMKNEKLGEVTEHEGFLGDAYDEARKLVVAIPTALDPPARKLLLEALREAADFWFYLTPDFRIHVTQKPGKPYTLEAHCRGWNGPAICTRSIRDQDELFQALEEALANLRDGAKELVS